MIEGERPSGGPRALRKRTTATEAGEDRGARPECVSRVGARARRALDPVLRRFAICDIATLKVQWASALHLMLRYLASHRV